MSVLGMPYPNNGDIARSIDKRGMLCTYTQTNLDIDSRMFALSFQKLRTSTIVLTYSTCDRSIVPILARDLIERAK